MNIYFASGNRHKRDELSRILVGHTVIMPADEGMYFNPEETETTFAGNALIKAKALHLLVQKPVLADDSGLCVDALGGAPGILSARYGSENGINLDSGAKNELLLSKMEGITNRTCRFVCSMVLYLAPERFYLVQETLEGTLTSEICGSGGFGYDPIVFVPEYNMTVAEMCPAEKDRCSHRGKAARKIACLLGDA